MKKFLSILAIVALFCACDKSESGSATTVNTNYSLVGKWVTESYNIKVYQKDKVISDSTYFKPFNRTSDILQYIRITDSLVSIKVSNDPEESDSMKYFVRDNYIMITNNIVSDTFAYVLKLNATQFNFSYEEQAVSTIGAIKKVHTYSTMRE
jgi:hypothetical protein